MPELIEMFVTFLFMSFIAFTGTAGALFYDVGVVRMGWITAEDFTNYLGFGFATPGPAVYSMGTFIGYSVGGIFGALIGTVAIMLVPIFLSLLVGKYLGKWLNSEQSNIFIQSVGLAAAGTIAAVGLALIRLETISVVYGLIVVGAFYITAFTKTNPLITILAGTLLGAFLL